jgi:DNA polymerase (family 10)
MPERNASIAAVLDEIANLLDIKGANPFRVRAYRNAARSVGDLGTEVDVLMARGTALTDIPGIGEDLAKKIVDILHTGTCDFLEQLHSELPAAITQLLKIPALGPRRVKTLYQDLHIENLEQLLQAAQAGQIRALPGFGEKTEQRILEAVQGRIAMSRRHPLVVAAGYAESLADHLRAVEGVRRVEIAGSYRRMRATVGDIDIVAIAADSTAIMDRFVSYPVVAQVLSKGPTRSSVLLAPGLQVDLRSLVEESFGAAMVYFTGSKAHNIAIRRMGQERGLKINEYGVFRQELRIAGENEESVYGAVDLPWIPPELREDRGEIEAAQKGMLPNLVDISDLQGDLHLRGKPGDSAAALVAAAQARGLNYVAIVFDTADLGATTAERVRHALAALNRPSAPTVLAGIEVGIGLDGKLDTQDAALSQFDLVIAAVRDHLDLPHAQQTQRVLTALQHARVTTLAQPLAAEGAEKFDIDFATVVRTATERGIALELSLHPRRMAPPDSHLEIAQREGGRILISSEAQSVAELDALRFSVGFARRGGLEAPQVLNCNPLSELRSWLESHHGGRRH